MFVPLVCVCRVLDEVLQKLVQLIQEEECVSVDGKTALTITWSKMHILQFDCESFHIIQINSAIFS